MTGNSMTRNSMTGNLGQFWEVLCCWECDGKPDDLGVPVLMGMLGLRLGSPMTRTIFDNGEQVPGCYVGADLQSAIKSVLDKRMKHCAGQEETGPHRGRFRPQCPIPILRRRDSCLWALPSSRDVWLNEGVQGPLGLAFSGPPGTRPPASFPSFLRRNGSVLGRLVARNYSKFLFKAGSSWRHCF